MRFLIIIITVLLFCSPNLNGQFDSSASLIEHAIRNGKLVNKIIYFDSTITYYEPISHYVKKGKLEGFKDTTKIILKLSKNEIRYLDSEMRNTKSVSLTKDMFPNSVMLLTDSLSIFADQKKGKSYFESQYGKKYFLFTKPVFTRNNSLAIFRVAEMWEPSAGNDLLFIYIKNGSHWEQHMIIYAGAW